MHGMEVNMDKDRRNTVKIVSTIISLGIIAALIIGVVSVIKMLTEMKAAILLI